MSLLSSKLNPNYGQFVCADIYVGTQFGCYSYCVTNRGIVYPFAPVVCAYIVRGAVRHREIGELLNPVDISIPKGGFIALCSP